MIGALLEKNLMTVSLFEGSSINTVIFNSWIEQDLVPKLPNRSVIVLNNATFHKEKLMKESLEKLGHILLYLPPYSRYLN